MRTLLWPAIIGGLLSAVSAVGQPIGQNPAIPLAATISDPNSLTPGMLYRELGLLEKRIDDRFTAVDKATDLFQANLSRVPTELDKAIAHVQELQGERNNSLKGDLLEKLHGVEVQILERDAQREEFARDNKVAVDAALSAQKEAVAEQNKSNELATDKMEAAFTKAIDQQGVLNAAEIRALNEKVGLLSNQVTLMQGRSSGFGDSYGYAVGGIGILIAGVALVMGSRRATAVEGRRIFRD